MNIEDEPMRLADALKVAFPHGGMTVSGLRREIARGRLEFEMIAGKQFVTLRQIKEMRERCRVKVEPPRTVRLGGLTGLSLEEEGRLRQAAALDRFRKRKSGEAR
jgi:hypothetical protein